MKKFDSECHVISIKCTFNQLKKGRLKISPATFFLCLSQVGNLVSGFLDVSCQLGKCVNSKSVVSIYLFYCWKIYSLIFVQILFIVVDCTFVCWSLCFLVAISLTNHKSTLWFKLFTHTYFTSHYICFVLVINYIQLTFVLCSCVVILNYCSRLSVERTH